MEAKKQTPFLDFYKACIATGVMTAEGLCICFACDTKLYEMVKTFKPMIEDYSNHKIHYRGGDSYWGSGDKFASKFKFTEFRQTIVLLCAAMNNEL